LRAFPLGYFIAMATALTSDNLIETILLSGVENNKSPETLANMQVP
jgi:hypothetical protein